MSGMDGSVEELNNATEVNSQSFLRFSPTVSVSTGAAAASYGRTANVYVYISIFLSLLLFLLTLLIIALHRLKNIISSSSSYPECSSDAGSSFTNMEICSISSQRSTVSSLS
ncbi:serine rich and transmembrane domain containing 1 [Danio aesculapii]|uniref:serine rich and transmembrane domain containing 1 n=1 Tax=Danio aesculapii TaxID=1142201 RepID=UPI0024C07D0F|nr:serine rich and transmembrane domain containing 1 [Danio aesculapii]